MQRVVISVRRPGDSGEVDFEVPSDVGAAELTDQLADALDAPTGAEPLELRAVRLGRALRPHETLAQAGVLDGSTLVLARASDPVEPSQGGGTALAIAHAPLAILPAPPPPLLVLPPVQAVRRSMLPFVGLGIAVLVLIGAGAWLLGGREAAPPATEPLAAPTMSAAPTELPTPVRLGATATAAPAPTPAPRNAPAPAVSDEQTAWTELMGRLDVVWGDDWPASISLLQTFHAQYPTRTAATEKLYAALLEYGRALRQAGAAVAAADAFDQAVRLLPQRLEARDELAAMVPTPTAVVEPVQAVPTPVVVRPPTLAPAPTSTPTVAAVVVEAPPQPARPGCDVTSPDIACPLADGARVQNTISVPDGRHFYWFGVPTSGMELAVEVTGQACPCTLFVLSDEVDNGTTPLATAYASDSSSTRLGQVMVQPGPYVLEVAPVQDGTNEPDATYLLAFGLRVPPTPTPTAVPAVEVAPTPPAPTPTPVPVQVPPVVARPGSEAVERLRGLGLVPQLESGDRFSSAGPGTVAAQDPPAGAAVPPSTTVTLVVATGNVVVPAVVGLLEQDASNRLHDAGLDIDTRHLHRSNVDAGRVADVGPGAGEILPAGSRVILTVSQGS